jgi:hypothetical protein
LNANRLTESNLADLDQKIQMEKYNREKREAIKNDRKAQDDAMSRTSKVQSIRPSTAKPKGNLDDLRSQKSYGSRVSKAHSRITSAKALSKKPDAESVIT